MYIFNNLIKQFIETQQKCLDAICIETGQGRWPLKILVYSRAFGKKQIVGFCNFQDRIIGLHQSLMLEPQDVIDQTLKHEYAHFLAMKNNGTNIQPHGPEFAFYCKLLQVSAEATEKLVSEAYQEKIEKNNIIEKIKKLLNLSESDNENESKVATAKANQLLLKYNLSLDNLAESDDIYMEVVAREKKANSMIQALSALMKRFNVYAIIVPRENKITTLEISGDKVNVEIASYIADYFKVECERLWIKAQKELGLKGLAAKNNFIHGLVLGYCHKIDGTKTSHFQESEINSLTVYNKKNAEKIKKMLYPNARKVTHGGRGDAKAFDAGKDQGSKMSFNAAIKSQNSKKLLS